MQKPSKEISNSHKNQASIKKRNFDTASCSIFLRPSRRDIEEHEVSVRMVFQKQRSAEIGRKEQVA